MFAEAKLEGVKLLTKWYFGRKLGIVLDDDVNGTLETAKELDQGQGNFREAANHYFYVMNSADNPLIKAEASLGVEQQLININAFPQALRFLDGHMVSYIASSLSYKDQQIYLAQIEGKKGWIADGMMDFKGSERYFREAANKLSNIPKDEWSSKEHELWSTTRHFLGRAHYGQAFLGEDRKINIEWAVKFFQEAYRLDRDEYQGENRYGKLGFGHAWLARCAILADDEDVADFHVGSAVSNFGLQTMITQSNKSYLAHSYLIEGEFDLKFGSREAARRHYEESLTAWQEHGQHPNGEAAALIGLGMTYRKQIPWELPQKIHYYREAAKVGPGAFKRLLGG